MKLNYRSYCHSNTIYHNSIRQNQLPTLQPFVNNAQPNIEFELNFSQNLEQQNCLDSRIKTTLTLECQRCLQPFLMLLEIENSVVLLTVKQANFFWGSAEFYIVDSHKFSVLQWLAEEISLSIPHIPVHPQPCYINYKNEKIVPTKQRPFNNLKQLLSTKENP